MVQKFDFEKRGNLVSDERKKILPAKKTLADLGLKNGDRIADIGCGIGYFTIPASEIVGLEGKVYAMDISSDMLNELKETIKEKNIFNTEVIKTLDNNLIITDNAVNFVFISTVLHEAEDLNSILQEIKRIMITNGKIAIIEWKKIKSDFGPPVSHRLESNILAKKLKEIGFKDITVSDLNEYLYTITGFK
ncbi:class I SAM-dependent methyltransferase [bacterium]|nr:class I SAM-dependent methyltransferase [bacterium]